MKIHMCCGKRDFGPGWFNIDGAKHSNVHLITKDIGNLPLDSESAELIYCSHAIEYFDREEIIPILKEWKRILIPQGTLRLAVPDFRSMAMLYSKGNIKLEQILGPLYGKMQMNDTTIYHKTVYDLESLKKLLTDIGFSNIRTYDWRATEHSQFDDHSQAYIPHMDKDNGILVSLNVEGTKP